MIFGLNLRLGLDIRFAVWLRLGLKSKFKKIKCRNRQGLLICDYKEASDDLKAYCYPECLGRLYPNVNPYSF